MFRFYLFGVLSLGFVGESIADMTVQECVQRIRLERERVETYVAKVTAITYGTEVATTGDSWKIAGKHEYECAFDAERKSLLITRTSFGSRFSPRRGGLLLQRGDDIAVADQGILTTSVRQHGQLLMGPDENFLNPMLVGLAGQAEMRHFVRTEDFFKSWGVPKAVTWKLKDGGDQLVFDRGREKVVFDKRFEFGVTQYANDNSGIAYKCKYKEVNGIWLPSSARIKSKAGVDMLVDIEWVSVNRPIDEKLFDPKWIARQTGLEWEAQ